MLHCGDCLDVMRAMPSESVDLVVTSPPYNLRDNGDVFSNSTLASGKLRNGYSGFKDEMCHDEYVAWQRDCLVEMMRLLSSKGAIFYNHKWRTQGKILDSREDITNGFPVRQIIIWNRLSKFNFNRSTFASSYEVVYLIAKHDFCLREGKSGLGDVWSFLPEQYSDHPAPFPVALPQRCIDSTDAQIVLDPFMGSGTTAIAAIRAGRKWIGIEQSEEYCAMAKKRIARYLTQPALIAV